MEAPVTTMPDAATLMIRRTFNVGMETLFDALTRADAIMHWFGPGDFRVAHAESDLRVGGSWLIEMVSPDGNPHNVGGEYLEIDAPRSVVFTWAWANEPTEVSQVAYALSPVDEATTTLTLTHTRLPSETSRDMHASGWNGALEKLAPWLSN